MNNNENKALPSGLRDDFEAFIGKTLSLHRRRDDEAYCGFATEKAWQAYQAAHNATLKQTPTAWYIKATGAFHLNYDRITPNEFLLGVTELREPL